MVETRVSECLTCPPWVIRCVHFEDGVVTFRDYKHPEYIRLYADAITPRDPHYGVFGAVTPIGPYIDGGETDDYDTALAAFHAAEEALLRGDE